MSIGRHFEKAQILLLCDFFAATLNSIIIGSLSDIVRYTGDWGPLFDELAKSSAALLCSHLTTQKQNPDWIHWKSFSSGDGLVEGHDLVRAFLPFVRLSKGLMRAIDERCRLGWAGHPEVLWPTIAQEVGLPIEEIGGSGSAVPPERRGKYVTILPWLQAAYF